MKSTIIVISRGRRSSPSQQEAENRLIRKTTESGFPVLVAPHLYDLPESHAAAERLKAVEGDILVFSWLAPRAAEWIVRRLTGRLAPESPSLVSCFSIGETENLEDVGLLRRDGEETASLEDLSGELEARWYPVLDYSRCTGCGQCAEFCLFGVYSRGEDEQVVVTHPDACKNGCPACSRLCPRQAIMFPHHVADPLISGEVAPDTAAPSADSAQSARAERQRCRRSDPDDDLESLVDELSHLDI